MTDVYREVAEVVAAERGPTRGLLRRPSPAAARAHACRPPGRLRRLVLLLVGRRVRKLDVWRCRCGVVWQLEGTGDRLVWVQVGDYKWTELGGCL